MHLTNCKPWITLILFNDDDVFVQPERHRPPPLTIPPTGVPVTVTVEPDRPHETTTRLIEK